MIFQIKNQYLQVQVASEGAQLWSVCDCNGREYLWQGDDTYWSDRSPNLFPFVGRLTDGKYSMDGKIYEMGIHGFAASQEFAVVEQTADTLVMELVENAHTLAQYPRKFRFRIIYTLNNNQLDVTYRVENTDEKNLYFGIGAHPGFRVPMEEGKQFTDYRLRFAQKVDAVHVGMSDTCFVNGQDRSFDLRNGTQLLLRHDLFDDDAIILRNMCRQVTLEAEDGPKVTVSYPDMPYLGIWHRPRTDAPYVCIEPWATLPAKQDDITEFEKELICLTPGQTYTNTWSVAIDA